MVKVFPDPSSYKYLYKCHHPVKFQPQFIEILETRTNIWKEFLPTMRKRKEFYPNISYVFLSNNKDFEIKGFFAQYPDLQDIYNVIVYDHDMYEILETKQYPFCILVSPNNKVLYQGSTMDTLKLQPNLHRLNVMASRLDLEQFKVKPEEQSSKDLSCYQLSMSLSGITKGGMVLSSKQQNPQDIFKTRMLPSFNKNELSQSVFLPQVSTKPKSMFQMQRSSSVNGQRQKSIDIFQSSSGLNEKLQDLGANSNKIYANAFIGIGAFQSNAYLMDIHNVGPTADQLRRSDEQINPQRSRQKYLLGQQDDNDELEQERRTLKMIERGHL